MVLNILLLLVGLALVVIGADILVDGSSNVARKAGISEFVIGLTIVAIGTSAPEMVVSFAGALKGSADIAVGNIIGSNIFNTLLILGLTAVMMPVGITAENKKKDVPFSILITVLLIFMGKNATLSGLGTDTLSRIDGIILVLLFCFYIYLSFKGNNKEVESDNNVVNDEKTASWKQSTLFSIVMIASGLGMLIFGGDMFVDKATAIAKALGISDKFIAITVLAGGTSMPEFATCVVAAAKKKGQLALGNILGSNVFNVLLILGGSAIINPLSFADINFVDLGVLLLSSLIVCLSAFTGKNNKIDRFDGCVMLTCVALYLAWLFVNL